MVRRAKYLAVCYQSGDNLLLESTENEVNLSKFYPTFVYLKTIIYICSNINVTVTRTATKQLLFANKNNEKHLLNSNIHRILMNECINIKELSNEKDYFKLITCIVLHGFQCSR